MWAHDRSAEHPAPVGRDDLDQALGLPLRLGAVALLESPAQHLDRFAALAGLGLGQADVSELGVGIGHPRQRSVIDLGWQAE